MYLHLVAIAALWLVGTKVGSLETPTGLAVAESDWPWWRGPTLDNHACGEPPPLRWNREENVLWRVAVPGRGHSSPVLWGERLFLTTAEGEEGKIRIERGGMEIFHPDGDKLAQAVLCYERSSGRLLWRRDVHQGGARLRHAKNSQASSTPACDGQRLIVAFPHQASLWLTALDMDGRVLWQQEAGPLGGKYGYAASPVFYQKLVIIAADQPGESWIGAFERATGKLVWRQPRKPMYSFSSPVVVRLAGHDQLVLGGQKQVTSYDPATGQLLWHCEGPSNTITATVAWWRDCILATGGDPQTGVRAIRADGRGDVTGTHILWKNEMKVYVPSPLVVEDRLVLVKDVGVATCLDPATGERLWEHRLGGNFSASPVYCGGLVFVPNEAGKLWIFRAGKEYEPVAENDLEDGGFASPVICGGRLYLRTLNYLWCIGR